MVSAVDCAKKRMLRNQHSFFAHFFAAGNHFSKITSDYMVQISGK